VGKKGESSYRCATQKSKNTIRKRFVGWVDELLKIGKNEKPYLTVQSMNVKHS